MNVSPVTRPAHLSVSIVRILLVAILVVGWSGQPCPAAASPTADLSFTVDSSADEVSSGPADGICNSGTGYCTLREALKEANANLTGNSTILFSTSITTINLTLGTLLVTGNHIIINGGGAYSLTVSGSTNPSDSDIFNVQGNYNTIQDITLRDSRRDGIIVNDPVGGGYGENNSIQNVIVAGSARRGIYVHIADDTTIIHSLIGSTAWENNLCATGQGNAGDGIMVDSGSTRTIIDQSRVVCNGASGIYINGLGGTDQTTISNSRIGTDGTSYSLGNGFSGVEDYLATHTLITSSVISRNGWSGIWLHGSTNAVVTANKIGTTLAGSAAMPNANDGILISDNAAYNTIGSAEDQNIRNLISGNAYCGIRLTEGANNNGVYGNFIGTSANQLSAIPNQQAGIALVNSAHHNQIGTSSGTLVTQLISGNLREGVYIENATENGVHLSNYIGLDGSLVSPLGNGLEGLRIVNATDNLVEGHYAYNGAAGIAVEGNSSTNNLIVTEFNYANAGLPLDLGNDGWTPNGSHTPPGPNDWLAYPVITGVSGGAVHGTACGSCYLFIYTAIGNPAAPRGGGQKLSLVTADASGNWSYVLPSGSTASSLSLVACTGGLSGSCSEMSPRPVVYVPAVRR